MNVLKKLDSLPYFRLSHLEAFLPDIKKSSIYQQISRWKRQKKIIVLKKGYYVTQTFVDRHRDKPEYIIYLANILRYPSYVSGPYVLQQYDVLTDITLPVTSMTTKSSRSYASRSSLGDFVYNSIKPVLYKGFKRKTFDTEPIYIATKSKALFDYLYIKYNKTTLTPARILERERLNLGNFTRSELTEFHSYCRVSGLKHLVELAEHIKS